MATKDSPPAVLRFAKKLATDHTDRHGLIPPAALFFLATKTHELTRKCAKNYFV